MEEYRSYDFSNFGNGLCYGSGTLFIFVR